VVFFSLSPLKYPPLENLFVDVATILETKIFLKGEGRAEREKGEKRCTKSDLKLL
jgi:hypothetical protein|tara:strand:+ start:1280 stop:1444 length:165 start_codon:yes stop_codon:yes gene_type:complete